MDTSGQQGWRAHDRSRRRASYSVALVVGLLGLLSAISRPGGAASRNLMEVLRRRRPMTRCLALAVAATANIAMGVSSG